MDVSSPVLSKNHVDSLLEYDEEKGKCDKREYNLPFYNYINSFFFFCFSAKSVVTKAVEQYPDSSDLWNKRILLCGSDDGKIK